MSMKFARTGIAALMLAGGALAGGALPAQAVQVRPAPAAQIRPDINRGYYVIFYYSNAQDTTLVGAYYSPGDLCGTSWGNVTSYTVVRVAQCGPS
jgi:hypothetical protein